MGSANFTVRYTQNAKDDLMRLYEFLLDNDTSLVLAEKALISIGRTVEQLTIFPYSYRKLEYSNNSFLREIIIPFGNSGYVAIFEIDPIAKIVTILALRHQREDDYR